MDPKYSMWISTDPALGEYIPQAPISDEAKKHNQNLPGMGGVFNIVNLNLYHYVANNPVKYTDPDGRAVKNASSQYVVIRLENAVNGTHYMILAPGDYSTADCDGFIFESSNMGKVSALDTINAVVDFTILGDNYPKKSFKINGVLSKSTNLASDFVKSEYNGKILPVRNIFRFFSGKSSKSKLDYSGQYSDQKEDGAPLNSWWDGITDPDKGLGSTQKEWKEKYENNETQKELQRMFLKKEAGNEEK